ncbi:MAG: CatA-like O-acetyltransferase [Bacillales bacterium]|nr:CatA-like O-acetyltransferase [Bacillales bacterium]
MKEELDLSTYKKRNQYYHFSKFPDPSFGLDVDIDVTNLINIKEATHVGFFPMFLYCLTKTINSVYELHLREEKGHIYYYDVIHPTWTVLTKEDVYMNVGTTFEEDFISFNKKVVELNSKTKQLDPSSDLDISSLCNEPNVFYASCLPILDVISFRHPTPSGDHDNLSIPRILWGKFILKEDNRYHLTLNITTSHCLVDGFPLAKVFINLREIISSFRI